MFNRRKLFGFAAAAPAVAFLPNNHVKAEVTKVDISAGQPLNGPSITLQAQRPAKKGISYGSDFNTISFTSYESYGPQLGIQVGQDGHMWLKVNDQWKRVVVE